MKSWMIVMTPFAIPVAVAVSGNSVEEGWVRASSNNTGNDSNPGTQAKPLLTIQAAAVIASKNNNKNIGTRVTL
jgi:hypothetical protein